MGAMRHGIIKATMAGAVAAIMLVGTVACGPDPEYRSPMQRMFDAFSSVENKRQQRQQEQQSQENQQSAPQNESATPSPNSSSSSAQ